MINGNNGSKPDLIGDLSICIYAPVKVLAVECQRCSGSKGTDYKQYHNTEQFSKHTQE